MKSDLDRLMTERQIDVAVIFGPDGLTDVNANFNYFTGGRHIVGQIIKKRGQVPVLIHGSMERDDAAATGMELINNNRWPRKEIAQQFPNPFAARVETFRRIFTDLGVTGRVGIYGVVESGATYALLRELERLVPGLTIVGEGDRDLIATARVTKDAAEVAEMASVGTATCAVVGEVRDWLAGHDVQEATLTRPDGKPLTVADVKRFVRARLEAHGLEHPGDFIFSLGRDAAVPHNRGNPADRVRLGVSIIFDIFPRRPGGYYHDMTRTWCLGYAPPEVQSAWQDVADSFALAAAGYKVGGKTFDSQMAVCAFLEGRGHPTIRQDPSKDHGYVHGLGHGLGLDVHEHPPFPSFSDTGDTLVPGTVFTLEPGLYYPELGFGVRIEDTYVCDPGGRFRSLTPFPTDLVVPMRG